MQQAAATPPAPTSESFAGLLAALASPPQQAVAPCDGISSQGRQPSPAWSDEGLADDYATLSYERALRTHGRYRSPDPFAGANDALLAHHTHPGPTRAREPLSAVAPPASPAAIPEAASAHNEDLQLQTAFSLPLASNRDLKSASITIRLSMSECAQLRNRAAEAGLTVSAYLRSCTFEAESLRALVKDTLAQLRSDPPNANRAKGDQAAANHAATKPIRLCSRSWWKRFWPWTHASRCPART